MVDSLKTDLYQIAMSAASYFVGNRHNNLAVCEAFARILPPNRRFFVMSGTESIREYLVNLRFADDDITFLKEQESLKPIFSHTNFNRYLRDFRFNGSLWAMAEGEIVFAGEPLVRVSGKVPEVHMAETFILSVLNYNMYISSKAARIVLASRGRPLMEFGTRRTHHDAALDVARSSYLAGFSSTSNVRASQRFGIPCSGTMSHMWVMLDDQESQAFEDFAHTFKNPTLLVDTYDTLHGTHLASKIKNLSAIRLDSGDIDYLSREARRILDENNCNAKIAVSGDMDEYKINSLLSGGAPIDMFGVGTKLVMQNDTISPGIVYKAVYDVSRDRPVYKLSRGKITYPGVKQVYLDTRNGGWSHLVVLDGVVQRTDELTPLLDPHIVNGHLIEENVVDLEVSRKYCNAALLNLHGDLAVLDNDWSVDKSAPVFIDNSVKDLLGVYKD